MPGRPGLRVAAGDGRSPCGGEVHACVTATAGSELKVLTHMHKGLLSSELLPAFSNTHEGEVSTFNPFTPPPACSFHLHPCHGGTVDLTCVVFAASCCQPIQLVSRGGEGVGRAGFLPLSPPSLTAWAAAGCHSIELTADSGPDPLSHRPNFELFSQESVPSGLGRVGGRHNVPFWGWFLDLQCVHSFYKVKIKCLLTSDLNSW